MAALSNLAVTASYVWTNEKPASSKASEDLGSLLTMIDTAGFYYRVLLFVIGWIFNPLVFMVFSRRVYRGSTTSIYLRILTVSDLAVLSNGIIRQVIERTTTDVLLKDLSCQIGNFLTFFCVYTSSWVLVAVTGERVVAIIWPHKIHIICSVKSTVAVFFCLFLFVFITSLPYPFVYNYSQYFDPKANATIAYQCVFGAIAGYPDLLLALGIIDSLIFVLVPTLLLVTFNTLIVTGVVKSRNRVFKLSTCTKSSSKNDSLSTIPGKEILKIRKEFSLTVMLIAVNTAFVVCNLPICAWSYGFLFETEKGMNPSDYIVYNILSCLVITNNALNFVLYCATGSKFRTELKAMLGCHVK